MVIQDRMDLIFPVSASFMRVESESSNVSPALTRVASCWVRGINSFIGIGVPQIGKDYLIPAESFEDFFSSDTFTGK